MSVFDQRGQKVTYQYNAAGNINFGVVQDRQMLIGELQKLKNEIEEAGNKGAIDPEVVTDMQYHLQKAIEKAKKPEPSKNSISEHLEKAKSFVTGVANVGGIAAGITKAVELVQKLF